MTGIGVQRSWVVVFALLCGHAAVFGQRLPEPGFNLFSREQDIEIGKEGASEIEKQVELVGNHELNEYLQRLGGRLASQKQAGEYPYSFKIVHDDSINAFALPGGPTYVHTGLLMAAENEAQLAGVMAHEIAHVALRHGTNQASKASLFQLGAMLGGGLLGGGSTAAQLAQLGIGFGANSVLLKFSRTAERQADVLGAHMMAGAGYDPMEMARFFEKLEAESGRRGAVEQFFSSHPNPGNRTERVQEELRYIPQRRYDADSGALPRMKAILKGLPPPKAAKEPGAPAPAPETAGPRPPEGFRHYQGREFTLSYPANWDALGERDSASVTFAPRDGIVATSGGGSAIGHGLIVAFYDPGRGRGSDLGADTDRLIQQLRAANPSIEPVRRPRQTSVDGAPALLTTLHSDSPFQGEREVDLLLTVARPQGLYYMVFVALQREFREHQSIFEQILRSVRFSN